MRFINGTATLTSIALAAGGVRSPPHPTISEHTITNAMMREQEAVEIVI
jgi:hypothetical protein